MEIQNTTIFQIELFLKNFYSLYDNDLAFGEKYDNHLTVDKINSQYYSKNYQNFINLKISQTAFINIPEKLFLPNIKKYDPDSICWFYYHCVKFALEKLFIESNRVTNLIIFLNNHKNPKLEQLEKYLQQALFKTTSLMEYFKSTILTEAAQKASHNNLILIDLIGLMENDTHTADDIALILQFANEVREFAVKGHWLLNMREYGNKIQGLIDGVNSILKETVW